jgi:beta-lactamase regulating signal transducer with metallopeptidase domain
MNILRYMLEANTYLFILFIVYRLLLSRSGFHTLNRAYLLLGSAISFIIPLLNFSTLPAPVRMPLIATPVYQGPAQTMTITEVAISLNDILVLTYFAGVIVMSALFIYKIYALRKLSRQGKAVSCHGVTLIYIAGLAQPFSFFKRVFLPLESEQEKDSVVMHHELIHARERHSLDIVLLELLKIISWCMPLIYFVQRQLKLVHEYIVDEKIVSSNTDLDHYIHQILRYSGIGKYQSISSGMNRKDFLSNRIRMMYHTPESPVKKLKFLLPVLLLPMAVYASSKMYVKDYGFVVNKPAHISLNPVTPAKNTFLPGNPDESHSSLPPQLRDTTGKQPAAGKKVPKNKKAKIQPEAYSFPIVVDTSRGDTIRESNGKVIIMNPLIVDTTRRHQ